MPVPRVRLDGYRHHPTSGAGWCADLDGDVVNAFAKDLLERAADRISAQPPLHWDVQVGPPGGRERRGLVGAKGALFDLAVERDPPLTVAAGGWRTRLPVFGPILLAVLLLA